MKQLVQTIEELGKSGELLSIAVLKRNGITQDVLDRVIVIDFGNERSSFDGFEPSAYFIAGRTVRLDEAGRDYR